MIKYYKYIFFFSITTIMVKLNIQNKLFTANAYSSGPQAIFSSISEFLDLLNMISYASSRAGKHVHYRGYLHTCYTIRCSSKSIFATKDSRKASPELSSTSEEEKSNEKEVSSSSRISIILKITINKLFYKVAPF